MKTQDERYIPLQSQSVYKFLDIESTHAWNSATKLKRKELTSTSGTDGELELIESEVLFGAFFFLSDKKIEHTREV